MWTIALFLKHPDKLPLDAQKTWQQVETSSAISSPGAGRGPSTESARSLPRDHRTEIIAAHLHASSIGTHLLFQVASKADRATKGPDRTEQITDPSQRRCHRQLEAVAETDWR
jgi:hypothetical protein